MRELARGLFFAVIFGGVLFGLNFFLKPAGGTPLFISFIMVVFTGYRMGKLCARVPEARVSTVCIAGAVLAASLYALHLQGDSRNVLPMVVAMVASLIMGYSIVSAQKGGKDAQDRRLKP